MSQPILLAHGLRRTFGDRVAVNDVSLNIDAGQIVGVLGPNGAGKTTTVRMCATLLAPSSGTVVVDGIDAVAKPHAARRRTGLVLGGDGGFYVRATARRNLLFFADVAGVPGSQRKTRVATALEAVNLSERADDAVRGFSRGMRQRLHLARALLNAPSLLLLDEPTSGLDPEVAGEIRDLIRQLADSGTAILLTSHYLAEVERLADNVHVLSKGRALAHGSVAAIGMASGVTNVTTFSISSSPDGLTEALANSPSGPHEVATQGGRWQVRIPWRSDPRPDVVERWLDSRGLERPIDLVTRSATLEESYLALVSKQGR